MPEKPIIYALIPKFNQLRQAVFQTKGVDNGDHIFMGVEIRDVPQEEGASDYVAEPIISDEEKEISAAKDEYSKALTLAAKIDVIAKRLGLV